MTKLIHHKTNFTQFVWHHSHIEGIYSIISGRKLVRHKAENRKMENGEHRVGYKIGKDITELGEKEFWDKVHRETFGKIKP